MMPVEKTSITPRVKNIRSNSLPTISPLTGIRYWNSSRNPYQLSANTNAATTRWCRAW